MALPLRSIYPGCAGEIGLAEAASGDTGANTALVTNPEGTYLKKALPGDSWRKPYQYQPPGSHGEFDFYSHGRDGTPGGEGEDKDVTTRE